MPLSINVGLSRKASRDYQSAGVSINVTAELDATLLFKPDELQTQVANLYAQAEQALDRQAGVPGHTEPQNQPARRPAQAARPAGYGRNGNGNGNGNHGRSNGNGGGMTESQRKAIFAIAHRIGTDPAYESDQVIGTRLDDLTVRQASELIDHLKGLTAAGNGR